MPRITDKSTLPKPSLLERVFDLIADKDYVYDLGLRALKGGDVERAIKEFSRVVRLDPTDASAHCMLAGSLVCAEEYVAAWEYFREFIRLKSEPASRAELDYLEAIERAASMDKAEAGELVRDYVKKANEGKFPFWG